MSKYNARKTSVDGHTFDSKAEGNYYLILKEKQRRGEIESFKLQPKYILQDGFRKNGKKYQPITYKADFEVYYPDGEIEVIDVKGVQTEAFKIKAKMFERRYPDLTLTLVDGKGKKK